MYHDIYLSEANYRGWGGDARRGHVSVHQLLIGWRQIVKLIEKGGGTYMIGQHKTAERSL